jgi:hypothetical protein
MGLQPLACLYCRLESRRGHRCLSLVNVCVAKGSDLCDELITRTEEPYRLCVCACVCVFLIVRDLETSTVRQPRPELGCSATEKEGNHQSTIIFHKYKICFDFKVFRQV